MYIFVTVLLAVLIGGYGVAFAFGCRLPKDRGSAEPEATGRG